MASISLIISLVFVLGSQFSLAQNPDLQTYIVRLSDQGVDRNILRDRGSRESWLTSLLSAVVAGIDHKLRVRHFYHRVFPGFVVQLTHEELEALKKMKGFVSAWPERSLHLRTTYSPKFLGLQQNQGFWQSSNYGQGIIIGVLDSGIAADHPSFGDEGMPAPPAKWKGGCQVIQCNNKLIGAKTFIADDNDPLDQEGHGTHVAGIAAGNFVAGANVFGIIANGTAAGIAPRAHLAMYKVCTAKSCFDGDILAGIDAAIADGVDVLSLSLGNDSLRPFHEDSIAIGTFSAVQTGVFVSTAPANSGPGFGSITDNVAPWVLTVGASNMDRKLRANVILGNNQGFYGESVYQPKNSPATQLPLVYLRKLNPNDPDAPFCNSSRSLTNSNIGGKIVLCMMGTTGNSVVGKMVNDAGGAGMILMNDQTEDYTMDVRNYFLPASHVNFEAGQKIINYVNTAPNPTAQINFKGTVFDRDPHAPAVASFSGRGPSPVSPGILKPDIVGPGVNILAAWPFSIEGNSGTTANFNILSGTSMACPHLSGVAALLKSSHPDWSPAAIKSAMMTTANPRNIGNQRIEDQTRNPADFFAVGAGHVMSNTANHPGLIYDIRSDDYIKYLCGLGYTDEQVRKTVSAPVIRCGTLGSIPEAQLNYPSFSIRMTTTSPESSTQTVTRTVRNVGRFDETYNVQVIQPNGVQMVVEPTTFFLQINQQFTYRVTFTRSSGTTTSGPRFHQGALIWNSESGRHSVRSPIMVEFY
ncbi:OLC1v1029462C1 [Oldenlandia corymbosa var. corymbosa]|nr:OLC1v1029462C1 [Oldenlandia corymbosa var. corymbosa]